MSRGDLDAVWQVVDKLRDTVSEHGNRLARVENESEHCKKKQDQTDYKIDDMCGQLKNTEKVVRDEIKAQGELISAQLNILMDAHLIRKGAESAAIGIAKHMPKIIIAIVSATFAATVVWMSKP